MLNAIVVLPKSYQKEIEEIMIWADEEIITWMK